MAFIRIVSPEEADGELREIYGRIRQKRGSIANVHAIHSLNPRTMEAHIDFYLSVMFGRSGLSRRERETIALAVSHANQCTYCVGHHADALARYQKDASILGDLRQSGRSTRLSPREQALVDYAVQLTNRPQSMSRQHTDRLWESGFNDEEILTATLAAAYFNFVNRLVLGLGVDFEKAPAAYKD